MKGIGFIVFYLIFLLPLLKGQEMKDTVKLSTVVVNSNRQITERALFSYHIDTLALASASNTDMSNLLLKNSSLYLKTYGNGGLATASFRGTSASHTQVLWNGLNINSPLGGQTDLSLVPVFFVDDVSLYYGSSSLVKTTGGLGGCINLTNAPQWDKGLSLTLSQGAGSFGYLLSQIKLGQSSEKFITNTRVFLEKAKNNFRYYDNITGLFDYTRQKNAAYLKDGVLQEFYLKLGKKQFAGLKFLGTWNDRDLPPIMSYQGAERTENQKDRMLCALGEWKGYFSKFNLAYHTGLIQSKLSYILLLPDSSAVSGGNYNTESNSRQFFNKLSIQYTISGYTVLKINTDAVFTQAGFSDKFENNPGFNVSRKEESFQSSLHHIFNDRFSGYGLVEQKILDGNLLPFVFGTGAEFKLSKSGNALLRTNLGRNIHIPNLNDIYFSYSANNDLKPEIGYQGDVGILYGFRTENIRYQLDFTLFTAWVKNWILWQPTGYGLWTARNVEQVFSRGAELNANMKGNWGNWEYLLKGNYSFTRTTNEVKSNPTYGMQLIYIPKHVSNLNLTLERIGYASSLSMHYTGSRYASSAEESVHQLPGYFILDWSIGKKVKISDYPLEVNFRLNNIFNKQYQVVQQRAMPGINFNFSVSINI